MLVGNKVDMGSKRAVSFEEGNSLGNLLMPCFSIEIRDSICVNLSQNFIKHKSTV
jgi:hypothetical protein